MTRHRTPDDDRALLAAVRACPDRGPVLPVSRQPSTTEGCRCGEASECRAGRGTRPGTATLEECVRCRYEAGVRGEGG